MNNNKTDFLKGQCLVASPCMNDERFQNTVIYVCEHSKDGAMGFVINQRITEFSFMDLAMQLPINFGTRLPPISLYQGGPVDKVRGFVLHSTDYSRGDCIQTGGGIAISASIDILSDIAKGCGPQQKIIALGYASWEPWQLEKELIASDWLVVPATSELVFQTKDEDKWTQALKSLNIEPVCLSRFSGRA